MGNVLTQGSDRLVVVEQSLLKDYKNASVDDYAVAKSNFDAMQEAMGDKMTVTDEEFDEIFSLICQDPSEHFKLFDCWELGKVDVMEVFAVVIVYCKAPIEAKIPLLFDLFDFDQSREISQNELVLLMLCTTRGLCKAVGLERPDTMQLEELSQHAFLSIDRDHNGQISLDEFKAWALQEPSVIQYLRRFASTRLIYDSQLRYDAFMKQLCDSFVQAGDELRVSHRQLARTPAACRAALARVFPTAPAAELEFLLSTMQATMRRMLLPLVSGSPASAKAAPSQSAPTDVTMDVFCMVVSAYAAFLVADEDGQHVVDMRELHVLLWLIRGSEPPSHIVTSFMRSLDLDQNGVLSVFEWVSFAVENDARTGAFSFTAQLHLLFTSADRNGDAVLSIQELINGLKPLLLESLLKLMERDGTDCSLDLQQPNAENDSMANDAVANDPVVQKVRRRRISQAETVNRLITGLANELMQVMDKNQSHRIEWFEFRQHVDYLQQRIEETKRYIREHVLV
ncbi:hypothetical protein P43SY_009404 [Pythium insidiosum]|uniref:EF-hand domain-containing protein n=1 Tax=Pythium insidiosum TaxID=114742 RepID=A0AAD5LDF8_PYTIN|nr:hypothetical protein P43SY_009404 [Pythium insidiosum]